MPLKLILVYLILALPHHNYIKYSFLILWISFSFRVEIQWHRKQTCRRIVENMSWTPLHQIWWVEATCWPLWRHPNCLFVASRSVGTSWWKYDYLFAPWTSACVFHNVFDNVFERHATKCCGILKIQRRKTQGSKRITLDMMQQLKAKKFDV